MTPELISFVVDGVVAVLLAVTIGYAIVLNRRLKAMKDEQAVMGRLISSLNQATAKAQEGIYELRSVAQTTEEGLKREINRARALTDELQLITEAGNNLAKKIEKGLVGRNRPDDSARSDDGVPTPKARRNLDQLWADSDAEQNLPAQKIIAQKLANSKLASSKSAPKRSTVEDHGRSTDQASAEPIYNRFTSPAKWTLQQKVAHGDLETALRAVR